MATRLLFRFQPEEEDLLKFRFSLWWLSPVSSLNHPSGTSFIVNNNSSNQRPSLKRKKNNFQNAGENELQLREITSNNNIFITPLFYRKRFSCGETVFWYVSVGKCSLNFKQAKLLKCYHFKYSTNRFLIKLTDGYYSNLSVAVNDNRVEVIEVSDLVTGT